VGSSCSSIRLANDSLVEFSQPYRTDLHRAPAAYTLMIRNRVEWPVREVWRSSGVPLCAYGPTPRMRARRRTRSRLRIRGARYAGLDNLVHFLCLSAAVQSLRRVLRQSAARRQNAAGLRVCSGPISVNAPVAISRWCRRAARAALAIPPRRYPAGVIDLRNRSCSGPLRRLRDESAPAPTVYHGAISRVSRSAHGGIQ